MKTSGKLWTLLLCLLFTLSLAACGGDKEEATADGGDETAATASTSPYNWLGYPDIPQCNYLDCLASQHYYSEYTSYIALSSGAQGVEYIAAVDGGNTYEYCPTSTALTLNLEGMIYSINEQSKIYRLADYTETYASAPTAKERAEANENDTGKVFQGSGTAVIPIYETIDGTEYEYYEYTNGEEGDMMLTERFYMKGGDVFAIYSKVGQETSTSEYTNIISKMTGEIPPGLFDLPDLSGYEQQS